jgi:site-specific recombinase XerD
MKNISYEQRLAQTIKKMEGAYAPSTIRAYKEDFEKLILFCNTQKGNPLPCSPIILIQFIDFLVTQDLTSASIRRAIAGISSIHRLNKLIDPSKDSDVTLAIRRMHRQLGRASKQAEPICSDRLQLLISAADNSIIGLRDKALLMTAYDTMCRRSELVTLMLQDIQVTESREKTHVSILLKSSKTDTERYGKYLHIKYETWEALRAWIKKANIENGYLFRGISISGEICEDLKVAQINRIYKRLAKKANHDEMTIQKISGHSLRVGAAQDLALQGLSLPIIMTKGRWSKTDTVMRYIERISSNY